MPQRIAIRPIRRRACARASRLAVPIVLSWVAAAGIIAADAPPRLDRDASEAAVRAIVTELGDRVRSGLWVGGPGGQALYDREPGQILPTASAIKTAILVELFARSSGSLDKSPPGLAGILGDDHPAIAHFRPEQRDEIREALAGETVRRIGGIMMGSVPAPNLVYNAAANVAIALLGGPDEATRSIRARDPAFAPIAVRRYMLADRKATGDNEATPAALAAVLQRLASRRVPGVTGATVEEIRRAILTKDDPRLGKIYLKDGDLESDPITCVRTGWCEAPGGTTIVYVVMVARDDPGAKARDEAHRDLDATATRLTRVLLDGVDVAPR